MHKPVKNALDECSLCSIDPDMHKLEKAFVQSITTP